MRPGLADPVLDSQRIFRGVLDAMSHPGRIVALAVEDAAPGPLHPATEAVCLALVDFETPLWLDPTGRTADVTAHLRFHCGCPIVEEPGRARFAVITDPESMPPLDPAAPTRSYNPQTAAAAGRTRLRVPPACGPTPGSAPARA